MSPFRQVGQGSLWTSVVPISLLVASIAIFAFAAGLMDRGFELTDEGYYLNSAATPELYRWNVTLFGRMLHPLLTVLNHNIALYRLINLFALVACQALLVAKILQSIDGRSQLSAARRWLLAAPFSVAALQFYCIWLPTPNYNSLNVLGATLFAYAAATWRFDAGAKALWRAVIVGGLGMAICALAKPSTGALLIPLVLLASAQSWRRTGLFTIGTGVVSLVSVVAYLLAAFGSLSAALESYQGNIALTAQVLGFQQTSIDKYLWRSLPFPMELTHIGLVLAFSGVLYFSFAERISHLWLRLLLTTSGIVGIAASCSWVQPSSDNWNRAINWTVALAALTFLVCRIAETRKRPDWRLLTLAIVLILIPFAVGFGSNTGMTRSAGQAGAIWTAGAMLTAASVFEGAALRAALWRLAALAVISSAIVVNWSTAFPQRQAVSLLAQNTRVDMRGGSVQLLLDENSATYFMGLKDAAERHGFSPRTPVIDMTGTSPGTIYLMGGDAIGWAYFATGYPGSLVLLKKTLETVPPDVLQRAWVLTAEGGNPPAELRSLGLEFPEHYELVTRVKPSMDYPEQSLWRPLRKPGDPASGAGLE